MFHRSLSGHPSEMQLLNRLEEASALDGVSDRLQTAVSAAIRPQRLRDLLHGTWLGHPLHPVLVQVPVGAFVSATVLDLLPRTRRASTTLVGLGVASAVPAAIAGWNDWASMSKDRRRVGLIHAAANAVGIGLFGASLVARLRGKTAKGKALGFAGLSMAGLGAYLGGHLSYAQGAGFNHAAPDVVRVPESWTSVGSLSSLPDGKPTVRTIGDVPVLLYRMGDDVTAMMERCSHESGPLGEGDVIGAGREACVVCPWHGSTFRLRDGVAVHGPAANDQPLLRVRVRDDVVEVAAP